MTIYLAIMLYIFVMALTSTVAVNIATPYLVRAFDAKILLNKFFIAAWILFWPVVLCVAFYKTRGEK